MCYILKEIYQLIYREKFIYENSNHRIKLQNVIYLLENMGINIGDYSFVWGEYGPYSISIDFNAKKNNQEPENKNIVFSKMALEAFDIIKQYLSIQREYDQKKWIECIASLHYLKNVFHIKENCVITELQRRKDYFNFEKDNQKALKIVNNIKIVK